MPTITVRLDDDTRDALQQRADAERATVSDFVRDLIREQVVSVRADDDVTSEVPVPESLSVHDRRTLSLLHRILARVLPEEADDGNGDGDAAYQLERAEVLEKGFTQEYRVEFAGISTELSNRDCKRVMDILDMFRIARYSLTELEKAGTPGGEELVEDLRFWGFDHNDPLEGQMADYVRHLVADDRWSEQADFIDGPTGGNSHSPTLGRYLRMLAEYRRIRAGRPWSGRRDAYLLTADELTAVAAARTHPDNR